MLRLRHPPGYEPERRYIHDVLLRDVLGLSFRTEVCAGDSTQLTLDGDHEGKALTLPDRLFQTPPTRWLRAESLPARPLQSGTIPDTLGPMRTLTRQLPVVYGRLPASGALFWEDGGGAHLGVDVFGSAFFLLTRYEERVAFCRDVHERFPDEATLAVREGFVERPLVDEYVEILWAAMRRLWPHLPRTTRRFRLVLTHDIDWPTCTAGRTVVQVLGRAVLDALRQRDERVLPARLTSYLRTRRAGPHADLWNTFDYIMDVSERAGLASAFYVIADRSAGKLDGSYSIDDPWIRRLMRRIHARGHELGLHTSYASFADPARIAREFDRLRAVCREEGIDQHRWGGRGHYLRWRNPITWRGWAEAGLTYDSTLGFRHHAGFRASTCREYQVYDLDARRPLPLRERPLVAMEDAVFAADAFTMGAVYERLIRLAAICRAFEGDFVLLWHNNWLASDRERLCYEAVVDAVTGS